MKLSKQLDEFYKNCVCPQRDGIKILDRKSGKWIIDERERFALPVVIDMLKDCDL